MLSNDMNDMSWHLDKRVPISLILTIVFQTITIAWWASGINGRVERLEQDLAKNAAIINTQQAYIGQLDVRLATQQALLTQILENQRNLRDDFKAFTDLISNKK